MTTIKDVKLSNLSVDELGRVVINDEKLAEEVKSYLKTRSNENGELEGNLNIFCH